MFGTPQWTQDRIKALFAGNMLDNVLEAYSLRVREGLNRPSHPNHGSHNFASHGSLWVAIDITQNSPFEGCAIPPLVVGWGRRYIGHEVEALTPVLGKLGTKEGLGSQWCNRLPRCDPRYRRRRCDYDRGDPGVRG